MMVAALVSGLTASIRATNPDLVTRAKGAEALKVSRRFYGRNALVAVQVALSVTLLVSAGLFVKSFIRASAANLGFRTDNILLLSFHPELAQYPEARTQAFYQELQERVRMLPGVKAVTL